MRFSLLLGTLVGACCTIAAADAYIHVGFDLKPTYGTSAVAFANGTLVGIAHAEGSDDYKNAMRKLSLETSKHLAPPYEVPMDEIPDRPRRWWRKARKSMGLPASAEVGALSTLIKDLKEKTEEALDSKYKISEAAASVPRLPAIYDEDLYDAFEYVGMNYLQIKWHQGGPARNYLTYDAQVALAGHNFSLCWDYKHKDACGGDDRPQDLDMYLVVTYTRSDLMVTNIAAHGQDLYHNRDTTSVRLGLGRDSPLRTSDEKAYWDQVRIAILEPLTNPPEDTYPAKIIFVGDAVEDDYVSFVGIQVQEYMKSANRALPETITSDPIYVQAKGAAELARRRSYMPTPMRPGPYSAGTKSRPSGEGLEL